MFKKMFGCVLNSLHPSQDCCTNHLIIIIGIWYPVQPESAGTVLKNRNILERSCNGTLLIRNCLLRHPPYSSTFHIITVKMHWNDTFHYHYGSYLLQRHQAGN